MLKETWQEFSTDQSMRSAAALSYYTVFALPPLLVLTLMLVGTFADSTAAQTAIVEQARANIGPEGADAVAAMMRNAARPGGGGVLPTVLSLAALVFGATGAFVQLQGALNTAWEVGPADGGGMRGFFMKRVLSFGMILGVAFLLLVSMVLSTVLSMAAGAIAGWLPAGVSSGFLWAVDLALSMAVITLLFAALFKILPDARIGWRDVWMGAAATAALFVVGKFLLGLYIGRSDPGSAYGAAGSLAVMLVWIYYSSIILLLGAEFTQVWARRRGRRIAPAEGAVRVEKVRRRAGGPSGSSAPAG